MQEETRQDKIRDGEDCRRIQDKIKLEMAKIAEGDKTR